MSVELLEKNECDVDIKELIKNLDSVKIVKDIYSIIVDKQLVKA